MKKPQSVRLTAAGALLVLALTLWPSLGEAGSSDPFWCFFCGTRDAADAILNIFLFVPLGVGLAAWGSALSGRRSRISAFLTHPALFAVLGSLALSAFVELAQTTLAGRHPSLEDLIFNTMGGFLGAVLFTRYQTGVRILLNPPAVLRAGSLLFPVLIFGLTSLLSRPQVPERALYGQWAHELGRMIPYPGRILSATSGDVSVPDALVSAQEALFQSLTARDPIQITAIAGPQPQALSHFFAIYDDQQEEVLQVAVQGPDLFFQERTVSVGLLFDRPFMRWEGVLNVAEGDTVRVAVARNAGILAGGGPCLSVGGNKNCGLAGGVESGWRLLHRLWGAPSWIVAILGAFWLFLISFPTGFLVFSGVGGSLSRAVAVGVGVGTAAGVITLFSPWLGFHWVQLWAPVAGVLAGWTARRARVTPS